MSSVIAFIVTIASTIAMQSLRWYLRRDRGHPIAWVAFMGAGGNWLGWPLLSIPGTYMLILALSAWT